MIDLVSPEHPLVSAVRVGNPDKFERLRPQHQAWVQAQTALLNRATFDPALPVIVYGRSSDLPEALGKAASSHEARQLAAEHFNFGDGQPERIVIVLWSHEQPFFEALDRTLYDQTFDLSGARPGGAGPKR